MKGLISFIRVVLSIGSIALGAGGLMAVVLMKEAPMRVEMGTIMGVLSGALIGFGIVEIKNVWDGE